MFKRVVERLHNTQLGKLCIILDDLDKSEYFYRKHVYDKGIFEITEAGYLVSNILRHWFKNGQKILLLRPWEYFQLNLDNALQSAHMIFVQGLDHEGQKLFAGNRSLGCKKNDCQLDDACLGNVTTNHVANDCSLCKNCYFNNCHLEIQSLCYMPNKYRLLIEQQSIPPLKPIVFIASLLLHELFQNNELSFKDFSLEKVGRFAWEHYLQRSFIFTDVDFTTGTSGLDRKEINMFFTCAIEKSQFFSESSKDLTFLFSHILLQELLAALFLLSLPTDEFDIVLETNKHFFQNESFAVLNEFMSVICSDLLLKNYHKTIFRKIHLKNIQTLQKFLGKNFYPITCTNVATTNHFQFQI